MLDLDDVVITKSSSIERKIYVKSSLIGIRHGLEDMLIELNEDDLMVKEWNIVINHPEHPASFLSKRL